MFVCRKQSISLAQRGGSNRSPSKFHQASLRLAPPPQTQTSQPQRRPANALTRRRVKLRREGLRKWFRVRRRKSTVSMSHSSPPRYIIQECTFFTRSLSHHSSSSLGGLKTFVLMSVDVLVTKTNIFKSLKSAKCRCYKQPLVIRAAS